MGRACVLNVAREGKVLYAPLYMTFCLGDLAETDSGDFTFAPAMPTMPG